MTLNVLKKLQPNPVSVRLIPQLSASATSIGSNYREANEAESKRDFIHKSSIRKKEAKETLYWIQLLVEIYPEHSEEFRKLWKEAHELLLIFAKIIKSSRAI